MTEKQGHTDIVNDGWVGRMPLMVRPYLYLMRLDRPIGTWLLLLPAWWAILLTAGLAAWQPVILFAVGALIMRSAGCVINDLWDRDLDGQVERTAARPLAAGDLTSRQAMVFLVSLLLLGLFILLQFNGLTILLGVVSLIFVVTYPLMKRITWWPQAFLGLTFNFGALMGWSAVTGDLPWQAWVLYASGFFWTLGYDTIYALQDRQDDAVIGVKSSARWLTEKYKGDIKIPLYGFYMIHACLLFTVILSMNASWMIIGYVLAFFLLLRQVGRVSLTDPQNALEHFQSNRDYGLLVCGVILFGVII